MKLFRVKNDGGDVVEAVRFPNSKDPSLVLGWNG